MARPAKPLSPVALSVWIDACLEEISQGNEHWGIACLLATHTGLRRNILSHYTDDWRMEGTNGQVISLPAGQTACPLQHDGCYHCNRERYSADPGFFRVKKHTAGADRTIPVWEEWYDYHIDERRETHLPEYLDAYFTTNNTFGFHPSTFAKIVKRVAMRRHDTIANHHQGEAEYYLFNSQKIAPNLKAHDLRATWCTQCLRTQVPTDNIMDWGGWSSREMIDHYRDEMNDVSGEGRKAYRVGAGGRMVAEDVIEEMMQMGVDFSGLGADEMAEVVDMIASS